MKKLISHKKVALVGLVILTVLFITGWRTVFSQNQTPQYQVTKVTRGNIVSSVSASGQIINANFMQVTTNATGVIKQVYTKEGDQVFAGQNIAEVLLDSQGSSKNAQAWSSYLSAKSTVDSAQANLNSLNSQMWAAQQKFLKDSVERDLETDDPTYIQQNSDWLAAESKYKNGQAVIAQAQAALNSAWLSYTFSSPIINAPMSGIIGNLTIFPGKNMSSNSSGSDTTNSQSVAVIFGQGEPVASFNLTEMDISKAKVGQKATITLDGITGKTFSGEVISVDRIGSVSSGVTNYPVLIKLDLGNEQILPNMSATANIIIEAKSNILLIPSSAITTQDDVSTVRVLKNKQEETIPVRLGISSETETEVTSGLSENDEVITGLINNNINSSNTSPFSGLNRNSGSRGNVMFNMRSPGR